MSTDQQTVLNDWLHRHESWIYSIIASVAIGLSGIFPLVVIPIQSGQALNRGGGSSHTLRLLLSFAVGGLLGDVFLHLLPEAWQHINKGGNSADRNHLFIGMWVLLGIFTFIILEMIFSRTEEEETITQTPKPQQVSRANGSAFGNTGLTTVHKRTKTDQKENQPKQNGNHIAANSVLVPNGNAASCQGEKKNRIQIMGYLNLLANCIDNFTHGLAVAGSFIAGTKIGTLTTFAILIHEIPHEIGDFAILLRSGFSRWEAAKAQMLTATVGLLGALTALSVDSCESLSDSTVWILPFTAGGFLNIALVNVLPELLQEKNLRESFKQLACLLLGVAIMAGMTILCN